MKPLVLRRWTLEQVMQYALAAMLVLSGGLLPYAPTASLAVVVLVAAGLLYVACTGGVTSDLLLGGSESAAAALDRLEKQGHVEAEALRALDSLYSQALVDNLAPPESSAEVLQAIMARLVPLLYNALERHRASVDVVRAALTLVPAINTDTGKVAARLLLAPGALANVVKGMRAHTADGRVCKYGAMTVGVLVNAAADDPTAKAAWVDVHAAVDAVLEGLHRHPADAEVTLWSMYALLHLASTDGDEAGGAAASGACVAIAEKGGIKETTRTLLQFMEDERIANVCVLLVGLLVKTASVSWRHVMACGTFDALQAAVTRHAGSDKIQEVGSALLSVRSRLMGMEVARAAGGGAGGAQRQPAGSPYPPTSAAGAGTTLDLDTHALLGGRHASAQPGCAAAPPVPAACVRVPAVPAVTAPTNLRRRGHRERERGRDPGARRPREQRASTSGSAGCNEDEGNLAQERGGEATGEIELD
jgi:hypothetical protein